jgi:hypothetical protein
VPLRPLTDLSPADWFVGAHADWWTKVCLGPPGYEAYARLQLAPADDDSDDDDSDVDLALATAQTLRRVLPRHTATPDDCFFGQWEGSGWDPPLEPARPTFPDRAVAPGGLADRRYHLFAGTLEDSSAWDGGDPPHLMWPADRAWFVTKDVDPDWVGVGGTSALIDELLAIEGLDAAPSAYDASDWEFR